jgi:hypothetical protein
MLRVQPILGQAWREARSIATRLWYDRPAELIVVYLILAAAAAALAQNAGIPFKPIGYASILVLAFFCWRVLRRGWISRGVLIYFSVVALLSAAQFGGQWWRIQSIAVFVMSLAGLMLLLSPAVYARTQPGSVATSSNIRLRPRLWMVLAAPLAGIVAAGLTLAVTRRWGLPGRGCSTFAPVQSLPKHCLGVGRGFPIPVAATSDGFHTVSQLAFFKDCGQWAVLIFTVSYLLWLALHRRRPAVAVRLGNARPVAQPSQ